MTPDGARALPSCPFCGTHVTPVEEAEGYSDSVWHPALPEGCPIGGQAFDAEQWFRRTPDPATQREEIKVNWHEEGGGLVIPTGWGFVLYEVPQFGGEPRFVGHYEKLEEAKAIAESWT